MANQVPQWIKDARKAKRLRTKKQAPALAKPTSKKERSARKALKRSQSNKPAQKKHGR